MSAINLAFPLRINVNCALSGETLNYVRKLNSIISVNGYKEIDFSHSPPIPHITLLMGEVNNSEHYQSLLAAIQNFARQKVPLEYELGVPYLREPSKHFIFIDTLPQEKFKFLRFELYDDVKKFINCEFHGGPENVSHVTIGFAQNIYPNLAALIKQSAKIAGVADTFQLCVAGKRGMCERLLEQIKLS